MLRWLAWGALAAILILTVGPIQFRPHTPWSPNLERFAAFVVVGLLFALAYPRRRLMIAVLVIAAAGLFEVGQLMIPHRHPALRDFLVKAAGGLIGIAAARPLSGMLARHRP